MRLSLTGKQSQEKFLQQSTPHTVVTDSHLPNFKSSVQITCTDTPQDLISTSIGSSSSGVRTIITTNSSLTPSSNTLSVASLLRLPIFMNSTQIGLEDNYYSKISEFKDSGWIQMYAETPQEVYDLSIIGLKLAEEVKLPVVVFQDWITYRTYQPVEILDDKTLKKMIGEYYSKQSLTNFRRPFTFNAFLTANENMKAKKDHENTISFSKKKYHNLTKKLPFKEYPPMARYKVSGADYVIVSKGSTTGIVKDVVDELRQEGIKAGSLKLRLFRPFPFQEVSEALKNSKGVAVIERNTSLGSYPTIYKEIKQSFMGSLQSYVYGLKGGEVSKEEIREIFVKMNKKDFDENVRYLR